MFWGSILVIFGFAILLKNLGLISGGVWDVAWPLLIIAFGFSIMTRRRPMSHLPWCDCSQCKKPQ